MFSGVLTGGYPVRLLIADDDAFSRRFLAKTVEQWGYEPVLACNGQEAWEIASQDDAPKLLLLDWMMPDIDGLELCKRVRRAKGNAATYITMLTASNSTSDLISAINAGADDFVTKSFDIRELEVRLRAGKRIVELQEALWNLATCDPLTNVWNHGAIIAQLERELSRAERKGEDVAVIMGDIDHFKSINDTYGHKGGDVALVDVAKRLACELRTYDSVGRYGGEEFLILLPEPGHNTASPVIERLQTCIANTPFMVEGKPLSITMSFGVATAKGQESFDPETLVKAADKALYRAKENGRNRMEFAA